MVGHQMAGQAVPLPLVAATPPQALQAGRLQGSTAQVPQGLRSHPLHTATTRPRSLLHTTSSNSNSSSAVNSMEVPAVQAVWGLLVVIQGMHAGRGHMQDQSQQLVLEQVTQVGPCVGKVYKAQNQYIVCLLSASRCCGFRLRTACGVVVEGAACFLQVYWWDAASMCFTCSVLA